VSDIIDLENLITTTFQRHGINAAEEVYVKNDGDNLVLGWDGPIGPQMISLRPGLTHSQIENEIESALDGWSRLKGHEAA